MSDLDTARKTADELFGLIGEMIEDAKTLTEDAKTELLNDFGSCKVSGCCLDKPCNKCSSRASLIARLELFSKVN